MKWRVLLSLSIAELFAMSLWFSASAVVPALTTEWNLTDAGRSWLTMSVQIGFVAGTFFSALFNLSDIINSRHLFAISAFLGAVFNGIIGLFIDSIGPALVFRFLTGVCLAGVYPPGMKIVASWFRKSRGMGIGILIGALTLGKASPHVFKAFGSPDWRVLMFTASASCIIAGFICLAAVKDGPYAAKAAKFDWRYMLRAFKNKGVRYANFGYLGHMWELYAAWTWVPIFILESFRVANLADASMWAAVTAFFFIGSGAVGSYLAGISADRYGRTTITIIAMAISGFCCLAAGFLFGGSPILLFIFCLIWGFAIVADSAQFSASVTELVEPEYMGTALTLQTCLGFTLTLVSIRIIPPLVEWLTWDWTFTLLAIGPLFGIISMFKLKQLPEIVKVGGERR